MRAQIWPAEFEELLDEVKLPAADIDMPLAEYAKLVCAMLDIPVHTTVMEPLHLLFTLFSDFKARARARHALCPPATRCFRAAADTHARVTATAPPRCGCCATGQRALPAAVHRPLGHERRATRPARRRRRCAVAQLRMKQLPRDRAQR